MKGDKNLNLINIFDDWTLSCRSHTLNICRGGKMCLIDATTGLRIGLKGKVTEPSTQLVFDPTNIHKHFVKFWFKKSSIPYFNNFFANSKLKSSTQTRNSQFVPPYYSPPSVPGSAMSPPPPSQSVGLNRGPGPLIAIISHLLKTDNYCL